jgi:hypothetical protein
MTVFFGFSRKLSSTILSDLINVRSDLTFSFPGIDDLKGNVHFFQLPAFKKRAISNFTQELSKGGSLRSALKLLPFPVEHFWLPPIRDGQDSSPLNELETLVFLYHCFSWLMAAPEQQTISSLCRFLEFFNLPRSPAFSAHCNQVFNEMISIGLATKDDVAISEISGPILRHFQVNPSLESTFFPMFSIVVESQLGLATPENERDVITMIRCIFEGEFPVVQNVSLCPLMSHLVNRLNSLNPDAIYILCKASKLHEEQLIADSFLVLPDLLIRFVTERSSSQGPSDAQRHSLQDVSPEILENPRSFLMPFQSWLSRRWMSSIF